MKLRSTAWLMADLMCCETIAGSRGRVGRAGSAPQAGWSDSLSHSDVAAPTRSREIIHGTPHLLLLGHRHDRWMARTQRKAVARGGIDAPLQAKHLTTSMQVLRARISAAGMSPWTRCARRSRRLHC